jgi:UDP-N-acetylglucosamine diphosphorylase / glucose-1-phosphate thymidylyltransferase / UDP-N-acetylgalactosamine diphosphorylase / glucosamine-1-phosphate N-acetyltransferase / galactosamine-1-phosphate N-acetyltransferase
MNLCLFEDEYARDLHPLTYFRPVYELRCGIRTLRQKAVDSFPRSSLSLACRSHLAPYTASCNPGIPVNVRPAGATLYVNGAALLTPSAVRQIRKFRGPFVALSDDRLVAVCVDERRSADVEQLEDGAMDFSRLRDLPRIPVDAAVIRYPWDLLALNADELILEAAAIKGGISRKAKIERGAILAGRPHITIGAGTTVAPGVVIDARHAPVHIGRNVEISPGAVLEGPCAVGDGSKIRIHAKIYGGTSLGPVCKGGGEIEGSVMQGFANKQHDGFLGDSYLAEWVNLGAGTTNSNLKNTYGSVRVEINGESIDTGRMFVGLIAGDHVKTGINSSLNTGTVIGPSSNVFGGGYPPKNIPAFAWGGAGGLEPYDLERALAVAMTVMSRRNVAAGDAYRELFRHVHSLTAHERVGLAR